MRELQFVQAASHVFLACFFLSAIVLPSVAMGRWVWNKVDDNDDDYWTLIGTAKSAQQKLLTRSTQNLSNFKTHLDHTTRHINEGSDEGSCLGMWVRQVVDKRDFSTNFCFVSPKVGAVCAHSHRRTINTHLLNTYGRDVGQGYALIWGLTDRPFPVGVIDIIPNCLGTRE